MLMRRQNIGNPPLEDSSWSLHRNIHVRGMQIVVNILHIYQNLWWKCRELSSLAYFKIQWGNAHSQYKTEVSSNHPYKMCLSVAKLSELRSSTMHNKWNMTMWNTISPRCWLVAMWWHRFATFDDIILQHLDFDYTKVKNYFWSST